jgi:hypothetical protein
MLSEHVGMFIKEFIADDMILKLTRPIIHTLPMSTKYDNESARILTMTQ